MRHLYICLLLCLLLPLAGRAQGPQPISGTVRTEIGTPLPGATVFIKGTFTGSSTNEEGQFQLKADFSKPVVLSVSFIGYESVDLPMTGPDNALAVVLKPSAMLDQVVVAASRMEESIGQVPVTIEKINERQVQSLTSPDVIAGLNRFKSVDISSSSMLITSFSTRGFNSSRAERVLQLADYMDTQLPSLSSNFGNLLGTPILDVESMEILHGPASALYGANAFNGVLLFNSKDPFLKPGLTVRLRAGNRDFYNGELRYAQKIGEKLAFKVSGGYLTANEFIADNQEATNPLVSEVNNNPAGSVLNYDAVNRYGDVNTGYTFPSVLVNPATRTPYLFPAGHPRAGQPIPTPAELVGKSLFLPGYAEGDLLAGDTKAYSLKVAPSISYLLTNSIKLTVDYKYTLSNAIYQNVARYRFKNSGAHQGRVEVKGENWFVRAYSTRDFSGGRDPQTDGAYNLGLLGAQLANQPVVAGGPTYAQTYVGTYLGTLAQRTAQGLDPSPATAQQTAAARLLQPNSDDFNRVRDGLIHTASFNAAGVAQGSRVVLRSYLNDASAQYVFKNTFADLTVGGAYRQFLLSSDRTVFDEPVLGEYVQNYEYGGYAQATKNLLNERLRVSGALRVDNFKNFGTAVSPRASLVYTAGADKQHDFRVSYSRAFRSPTQSDQYVRFDVGRVILLGNVSNGFQGYSTAIRTAPNPTDASLQVNIERLRLEEVNTIEGGYRAQITKGLSADLNYYFNTYNDFVGARTFIGNTAAPSERPALSTLSTVNAPGSAIRVIQVTANVSQQVQAQGASIGLNYVVNDGLTVSGNYSFNEFITKDLPADFLTFFNTPKHKFNLGIDGRLLERKLSYNVNYRWSDSYTYESSFAIGQVPTIQLVDAQVGYTLSSLHTTFQAGVTNLLDVRNTQVYGASNIGRMGFFGLLFDIK